MGPFFGHWGTGKVMPAQMAGGSEMSQERNLTLPMGKQGPERWYQPDLGVGTSGGSGEGAPGQGGQQAKGHQLL